VVEKQLPIESPLVWRTVILQEGVTIAIPAGGMMKTFKQRTGHAEPTAAFSAYMVLTREEVAAAEALADAEGDASDRLWVRRIATEAVMARIAAHRASTGSKKP
jgi:hypothetical protein